MERVKRKGMKIRNWTMFIIGTILMVLAFVFMKYFPYVLIPIFVGGIMVGYSTMALIKGR